MSAAHLQRLEFRAEERGVLARMRGLQFAELRGIAARFDRRAFLALLGEPELKLAIAFSILHLVARAVDDLIG